MQADYNRYEPLDIQHFVTEVTALKERSLARLG